MTTLYDYIISGIHKTYKTQVNFTKETGISRVTLRNIQFRKPTRSKLQHIISLLNLDMAYALTLPITLD